MRRPLALTQAYSRFPLVNGPVNDGLFEVSPNLNQSLRQFSQVAYASCIRAPVYNPRFGNQRDLGMHCNGGHNSGGMKPALPCAGT